MTPNLNIKPDIRISVKQSFGIDSDMQVNAFSKKNEFVPEIDKDYKFDRDTTLAILSGFNYNKKVIVHGYHGTGKSTHITQVAARLNWPCLRINLDSHISRIDLIGKDAIVIKNGKQVTEFNEGIFDKKINLIFIYKSQLKVCFGTSDKNKIKYLFKKYSNNIKFSKKIF